YTIQTQLGQARQYDSQNDNYVEASSALLADQTMRLGTLLLGSLQLESDRILADQRVNAAFTRLAKQSVAEDAQFARDLLRLREQYVHVYLGITAAGAAGDQAELI